jgi:ribosomal protein S12
MCSTAVLNPSEQRIEELKDKSFRITQLEEEKRMKKSEESLRDLRNIINWTNTHIMKSQKERSERSRKLISRNNNQNFTIWGKKWTFRCKKPNSFLWDTAKAVLTENFTTVNAYIKKERSQITHLYTSEN